MEDTLSDQAQTLYRALCSCPARIPQTHVWMVAGEVYADYLRENPTDFFRPHDYVNELLQHKYLLEDGRTHYILNR